VGGPSLTGSFSGLCSPFSSGSNCAFSLSSDPSFAAAEKGETHVSTKAQVCEKKKLIKTNKFKKKINYLWKMHVQAARSCLKKNNTLSV
jgi:hypothetical protein